MSKDAYKLLDQCGWDVECKSPFEICHRDSGARATGIAAEIVEDYYKENAVKLFKDLDVGDRFYQKDYAKVFMMKIPMVKHETSKFNCATVNFSPGGISENLFLIEDNEEVCLKVD